MVELKYPGISHRTWLEATALSLSGLKTNRRSLIASVNKPSGSKRCGGLSGLGIGSSRR
jgi:hypothetical protein